MVPFIRGKLFGGLLNLFFMKVDHLQSYIQILINSAILKAFEINYKTQIQLKAHNTNQFSQSFAPNLSLS